jgi:hypothetical protein
LHFHQESIDENVNAKILELIDFLTGSTHQGVDS